MANTEHTDTIDGMTVEELLQTLREREADCLDEVFISDQQLAKRWHVHARTIKRNAAKLPPRYEFDGVKAKRRKLRDIIEYERASMAKQIAA